MMDVASSTAQRKRLLSSAHRTASVIDLSNNLTNNLACEQALELGVWVFFGGRGWGEGKEWPNPELESLLAG